MLTGNGFFNGQDQGWVVVVPAPGSSALLVVAGLAWRRRRSVVRGNERPDCPAEAALKPKPLLRTSVPATRLRTRSAAIDRWRDSESMRYYG